VSHSQSTSHNLYIGISHPLGAPWATLACACTLESMWARSWYAQAQRKMGRHFPLGDGRGFRLHRLHSTFFFHLKEFL
jgi:hypothetical protein